MDLSNYRIVGLDKDEFVGLAEDDFLSDELRTGLSDYCR